MYEYKDLIKKVKENPTAENIFALAEWFERYGREFWNGECYGVYELKAKLIPFHSEEENETGGYDVVGWELSYV